MWESGLGVRGAARPSFSRGLLVTCLEGDFGSCSFGVESFKLAMIAVGEHDAPQHNEKVQEVSSLFL